MQPFQNSQTVPAFLGKLWKMVNDPSTDHLISWSEAGNTFIIQNKPQFWYELVPVYYKHNNMSSFIRQLNLYGFHKTANMNPSVVTMSSSDKDDQTIQFYHPCFQRDKPEKLSEIKRKQATRSQDDQSVIRSDDLTKVLTDVKQLRGRQSSVDSQLSAMKQENAVLWRELAILRQKHVKQQQIVNKLIQFLVTLVQPAAPPRMGVGVKRRMPLMLYESPAKKTRARKNSRQHNDGGPTIHELDAESELSPEQLLEEASVIEEEEDMPLIDSPITPQSAPDSSSCQAVSPVQIESAVNQQQQAPSSKEAIFWDKPEFVDIENTLDNMSDNEEELIKTLQRNAGSANKVFLNPNNRDTLIGSHMSPVPYKVASSASSGMKDVENGNSGKAVNSTVNNPPVAMQVAKKQPPVKITTDTPGTNEFFRDDLDLHIGSTQNELDQLKDILNGCNNLDANALLGLFSENDTFNDAAFPSKENQAIEGAPSDQDVSPPTMIDFTELLDDDLTIDDTNQVPAQLSQPSSSLNTPVKIVKNEPLFPVNS